METLNEVVGSFSTSEQLESAIDALERVAGFHAVAVIDSPIRGGEGNLERLLHMRR